MRQVGEVLNVQGLVITSHQLVKEATPYVSAAGRDLLQHALDRLALANTLMLREQAEKLYNAKEVRNVGIGG